MTKNHRLHLDPKRILETARKLSLRVEERFPASSIASLSGELAGVAGVTVVQVETLLTGRS